MTTDNLDAFHQKKFRKTLWQTLLKITIYATLNNAIFLYCVGTPLIQTRPWTLFLKEHWEKGPSIHYLIWQIFVIINLIQIAWIIYHNFKEDLLTLFHQTQYAISELKRQSQIAHTFFSGLNTLYLILLSPVHHREKLYLFIQNIFLLLVCYLVWTSFFLSFFHYLNHYVLDPKDMIDNLKAFLTNPTLYPALKQALGYASLIIFSFIIAIKVIVRLHQKIFLPYSKNGVL